MTPPADVIQRLHEIRRELVDLHAELDVNSVESDEVARLITETRRGIEWIETAQFLIGQ